MLRTKTGQEISRQFPPTILIDLCALKLEIYEKLSYLDGSFKSIKERDRLHKYSAGKKNHNTRIAELLSRKVQLYELFTSRRDSDKQNSTIHTHTGDIVKRFNSGPTHECSAHVHLDSFPRPRRANTRVSLPGACAAITVLNYIGTCGTDSVNFVCNRVAELAHRRLIAFPIKHIAI